MRGGFFFLFNTVLPWMMLVVPLAASASLVLVGARFYRATVPQRRSSALAAGLVLLVGLLDAVLLHSLALLNVSHGPVRFSLIVLWLFRAALLLFWLLLTLRGPREQQVLPLWAFALVHAAVTAAVVYAFYVEPHAIRVSHIQIAAPVRQPLRILQISDLHIERTTQREARLPEIIRREQPDVIVLTGDYLNLSYLEDPTALQHARDLFAQLHAPYGVYAVNGSVDSSERMVTLFEGLNIVTLRDQSIALDLPAGSITILGINDWGQARDAEKLAELAAAAPAGSYRLLLYHTPDLAEAAAQARVDLYLAGHTHGGQIALPVYGAIVTSSNYGKRFEAGHYTIDRTHLYVSRGLGLEGSIAPRARFFAPPEVVVIDLLPMP